MHAVRAARAFDGEAFRAGGATVVVEDGRILGVETVDHPLPEGCPVTTYDGTLLPGLVDAHTHLVTDSGPAAGRRTSPTRRGRTPTRRRSSCCTRWAAPAC